MGVKRRYQFIEKKQQLRFAVTLSLYVLFFPFLIAALILSPFSDVLVGPEAEEIRSAVFEIAEFFLYHWDLVLITLGFIAYAVECHQGQLYFGMRGSGVEQFEQIAPIDARQLPMISEGIKEDRFRPQLGKLAAVNLELRMRVSLSQKRAIELVRALF